MECNSKLVTQILEPQSLQFPIQMKVMTKQETKEYHLKKLYYLSIHSVGEITQLHEPTDDQKKWVLNRLKGSNENWKRWYE